MNHEYCNTIFRDLKIQPLSSKFIYKCWCNMGKLSNVDHTIGRLREIIKVKDYNTTK